MVEYERENAKKKRKNNKNKVGLDNTKINQSINKISFL